LRSPVGHLAQNGHRQEGHIARQGPSALGLFGRGFGGWTAAGPVGWSASEHRNHERPPNWVPPQFGPGRMGQAESVR
jgi:hypothetical protein